MWAPADIDALPTIEDILNAKNAIKETEAELQDAIKALTEAQKRVNLLEQSLVGRRAWIAPMRRLPFELLAIIFGMCGKNSWEDILHLPIPISWQVKWKTPVLESYIELDMTMSPQEHSFHKDIRSTKYICADRIPPLDILPNIRVIQFQNADVARRFIFQLSPDQGLSSCPSLKLIEFPPLEKRLIDEVEIVVEMINSERSVQIKLEYGLQPTFTFPGAIPSSIIRVSIFDIVNLIQ
ncbi:hypothetical protein M408DRAFT_8647, partial [Serendipita vermifera MAFF 305830]